MSEKIAAKVASIRRQAAATMSRAQRQLEAQEVLRKADDLLESFLLEFDSMMSRREQILRDEMLRDNPTHDTFDQDWEVYIEGLTRLYGERVIKTLLTALDERR